MSDVTLITIEGLAKAHAADYAELASVVAELNDAIQALKRARMAVLKRRVAAASESKHALANAIQIAPHLFIRPRTVIIHGFKVGLRKGTGGIAWDDSDQVVALIKKHLAEQAETLIRTKESPIKAALAELDVASLKKIGCTVEDTSDLPVIKPVDSDVDKIVSALLESAEEEEI